MTRYQFLWRYRLFILISFLYCIVHCEGGNERRFRFRTSSSKEDGSEESTSKGSTRKERTSKEVSTQVSNGKRVDTEECDLSDFDIDFMIEGVKDGNAMNVFLVQNFNLKPVLLLKQPMRGFEPLECYIAVHRVENDELTGSRAYHIYYMYGQLADAIARLETAQIALSLFARLRNMPSAILHRELKEFDESSILSNTNYFTHLASEEERQKCDLYLLEADEEATPAIKKLDCYEPKKPRVMPEINLEFARTGRITGDGNNPEFLDFLTRLWHNRRKFTCTTWKLWNWSWVKPIRRRVGLRRRSKCDPDLKPCGKMRCKRCEGNKQPGVDPATGTVTPEARYGADVAECLFDMNPANKICLILRVTYPEPQVHMACAPGAHDHTKQDANHLFKELNTGIRDVLRVPHLSIRDAKCNFQTVLQSRAFLQNIDDNIGKVGARDTPMYKISSNVVHAEPMEQPLTYDQLLSDNCYILDTKDASGLYVWIGRKVTRKLLMKTARFVEKYFFDQQTNFYTSVTFVEDGSEDVGFKAYFFDWHSDFP